MLEGVGLGLDAFMSNDERRSRPLGPSELRRTIPQSADAIGCALPDGVHPVRYAMEDRVTKKTRWEVPKVVGDRPRLSLFTDHGPDVTAAVNFLMFGMGFRIDWHSDFFHDCDNDIMGAA
eukprot:2799203-Pyramimonas_sp.AAC.1